MDESAKDNKTRAGAKTTPSSSEKDVGVNSRTKDAVGYGHPPKSSRFKKGASGNPGGRPRGAKNCRALIYELADELISLSTQEGVSKVTVREAMARKFLAMALKGDHRFYKSFWDIETEQESKALSEGDHERQDQLMKLQMLVGEIVDPLTREYVLVKKKPPGK